MRPARKVTLDLHQVLHLSRKVTLDLHHVLRLSRKVQLDLHQVLRLSRKVTLDLHQVLRLPRKDALELHQVLRLPRKVTLDLHQVLRLPRKVTLDLHQVLRLPRKVTLDLHQVLRLPHRMTRRLDPRHIWNVISNARRNKCHPPNSPNTAPATQNDHPTSGRNLRKTAETSFPMRGRSETVPRMIRDRFRQSATRHATEVTFRAPEERFVLKNTTFRAPAIFPNLTKYCACHEKWHLNFTKYCAYHEKWHLNFTKYCAYHAKWHLNFTKYCAYHAKWHLNFTKYCAYHEKWHLTFTKYCACHTERLAGLILVTYETSFPMRGATNVTLQTHHILRLPRKMTIQHLAEICGKQLKRHFQCAADPNMIRDRFRQSATRHATEVTFRAPEERFVLKNTTFRAPAIFPNLTKYCACHEKWHLNFTKYCAYHEKWHLNFTKYCAYHAKWHLNFTKYCAYHAKWHLNFTKYCAYHEKWHLTFTKYCACHTEWLAGLILVTYETSFPMRGETNVTLQTHQILRLPRKMTIQHLAEICGKQLKRHFQCAADPRPFREWSEHDPRPFPSVRNPHATEVTFRAPEERFVLKNTTFRAPAIFPNLTKYCACHEKWHLNFTKYCAYHEKWHLNFTKYCAYHAKWHLNFTKYCAYHAKWHLNFTKYCAYHEK